MHAAAVATWNVYGRNVAFSDPIINSIKDKGCLLVCLQESPSWGPNFISDSYVCFSEIGKDCSILYHHTLSPSFKRGHVDDHWCCAQFGETLVISVHLPCGKGRVLSESPENNYYRDMLSCIGGYLDDWAKDDDIQHISGYKYMVCGADTNTKLIGNLDGVTGELVLTSGDWDDRGSFLVNFLNT